MAADNGPDRESRQETRNYEVNKTIQYVRSVPGAVNKLSVAVVVDYRVDENGESVPLDAALLEQVNALVRKQWASMKPEETLSRL